MTSRSRSYIALLTEMYGAEVVNSMLKPDLSINPEGLSKSAQPTIQAHLKTLGDRLSIDIPGMCKNWVFDFPCWVGSLDMSDEQPAREFVVIGEDPHLRGELSSFDIYCAYGICHKHILESQRLWQIVPYTFGHNNSTNIKDNMSCLEKYYATDLCHISPKGMSITDKNGNAVLREIRDRIARTFIPMHIGILSPRYIICNGSNSYEYLKNVVYALSERNERKETFSRKIGKRSIDIKAFDATREVTVVSFPHFTKWHDGFWNQSVNEAKELLNRLL